jgi:sulfite exporter TauE/SafE
MRKLLFGFGTLPLLVGVTWAAEPLSDPQMDRGRLVLQNGSVFET